VRQVFTDHRSQITESDHSFKSPQPILKILNKCKANLLGKPRVALSDLTLSKKLN